METRTRFDARLALAIHRAAKAPKNHAAELDPPTPQPQPVCTRCPAPPASARSVQTPDTHVPFEQGVPSGHPVFEHAPVAESQAPGTRHSSPEVQTTGLLPMQVPAWQVSVWVQAFPSLHAAPATFCV